MQGVVVRALVTCVLALAFAATAFADADVEMVERSATDLNSWAIEPLEVSNQSGQTVTWVNTGSQSHTATATGGAFDTGLIEPGESKTVALARQTRLSAAQTSAKTVRILLGMPVN